MFISEISLSGIGNFPEIESIISLNHNTLLCGNCERRKNFLRALELLFNAKTALADDFYDENLRISAKLTFPESDPDEIPEFFHHMRADESGDICAILEYSALKTDSGIHSELNWMLPHNVKRAVKPQELAGIRFSYLAEDEEILKNAIRKTMLEIFHSAPDTLVDIAELSDGETVRETVNFIAASLKSVDPAAYSPGNYISWLLSGIELNIKENKKHFFRQLLQSLLIWQNSNETTESHVGINLLFIDDLPEFNISFPGIQLIHSTALPRNTENLSLENIRCFSENSVNSIILPENEDDKKFLMNAVKLFPELISSRMIILTISADDRIFIEKFASISGINLHQNNISIIPLSGKKLHLLWQLLDRLGIPYLTLADLNHGLPGGDWEKIADILYCGSLCGKILPAADEENNPANIELIRKNQPDLQNEKPWINYLEDNWNVFLFIETDSNRMMLRAFQTELRMLYPEYPEDDEMFFNRLYADRNFSMIYTQLFSTLPDAEISAKIPVKICAVIEKIKNLQDQIK